MPDFNTRKLRRMPASDLARLACDSDAFAYDAPFTTKRGLPFPAKVLAEITRRTGISDRFELMAYVRSHVEEQDGFQKQAWDGLCEPGAVFRFRKGASLLETLRTYSLPKRIVGPQSVILARSRDQPWAYLLDEGRVTELEPVEDVLPKFRRACPFEKGLLTVEDNPWPRSLAFDMPYRTLEEMSTWPLDRSPEVWSNWMAVSEKGAVFSIPGSRKYFETIACLCRPGSCRGYADEILLAEAKHHLFSSSGAILAEFGPHEAPLLQFRYHPSTHQTKKPARGLYDPIKLK